MKDRLIIAILLLFAAFHTPILASESFPKSNRGLLDMLDRKLAEREAKTQEMKAVFDSISAGINNENPTPADIESYGRMGSIAGYLNCDSAIAVYTRGSQAALAIGDSVNAQLFRLYRIRNLGKLGAIADALYEMYQLEQGNIFPQNEALWAEIGRDLNLEEAEIFIGRDDFNKYLRHGADYARKEIEILPKGHPEAEIAQSLIYYSQGKMTMSAAILQDLLRDLDINSEHFSMAATILGGLYQCHFDDRDDEAISYLAQAAIRDAENNDRSGTSLTRLGSLLYRNGDVVRANSYLTTALENTVRSNAKNNVLMISEELAPVAKDIRALSSRRVAIMTALIIIMTIAIVLLIYFYRSMRQRMRELEQVKAELTAVNLTKDTYLSEFMNLSTSYIETLEDFNRICRRKLAAGQSEDLLKYVKDANLVEEQRRRFDEIFDNAFLAVHPYFIDEVNKLLIPEKRFEKSDDKKLTTEQRVLAFVCLGIDDTNQVSRFLNISSNTIYTYRNKFRNFAIKRDTFDSDLRKLH